MGLKNIMNGAPIPNWAKLIGVGLFFAWQAATAFFGNNATVNQVQETMRTYAFKDSVRAVTTLKELRDLDEKENRRNREVNYELEQMGRKIGYIARSIE